MLYFGMKAICSVLWRSILSDSPKTFGSDSPQTFSFIVALKHVDGALKDLLQALAAEVELRTELVTDNNSAVFGTPPRS